MKAFEELRPLERRILRWRESGATYDEIAEKFLRASWTIQQIEQLAHYKMRDHGNTIRL